MKTILFRGGMVGDLLLKMLTRTVNNEQLAMKKFHKFTELEKIQYYKSVEEKYDYVLSHDTDFCVKHDKNLVQIVCGDLQKLKLFSKRFQEIHLEVDPKAIKNAKKYINSNDKTFLDDYTQSILDWQNYYQFKNRFDIKNIGKENFVQNVVDHFKDVDKLHATSVYYSWLEKERFLI